MRTVGKSSQVLMTTLLVFALGGCATMPSGPSVRVLPAPGKPFEQFQADDAICRQWAERQNGTAQDVANENTASSAVVGTVLGAGVGAAIGAASGNPGAGAAIGAGSGLLLGTASGAGAGQAYGSEAQRRYDNSYVQCMYAKGNQVPGAAPRVRRVRRAPPPPPVDMYPVPPDYYPPPR